MISRASGSGILISAGLILLVVAMFMAPMNDRTPVVVAGFTSTPGESPVDTEEPPTEEPTKKPTKKPQAQQAATAVPPTATPTATPTTTPTPTPTPTVFVPVPVTGGGGGLSLPFGTWQAGVGLILLALGLAWRRRE